MSSKLNIDTNKNERFVIKVKKKNKKYTCGSCGKSFQRKGFYNKHILLCENILKTVSSYKENVEKEEQECMPSKSQMYRLLLDLSERYEKLNNEVQSLRKYVERTKKKINILEWLKENTNNKNENNNIHFNEWLNNIEISDSQLQSIFKYGYIDGIYIVLQENLNMKDTDKHPIKCFEQKKNVFYKFDVIEWTLMEQHDIVDFMRKMNHKIMEKFMIWKTQHNERIQNDDRFHDKYVEYMRTILGGNKSKEQSQRLILNKLFNYLKMDLKNIIQYEFVF